MSNLNVINVLNVKSKKNLPSVVYSKSTQNNYAPNPSTEGLHDSIIANITNYNGIVGGRASARRNLVDPTGRYIYYMKPFLKNGSGMSDQECEGSVYKVDLSEAQASNSGEVWSKVNTNTFPRDLDADIKSKVTTSTSTQPYTDVVGVDGKFYVLYKKFGNHSDVTNWDFYEYDPATDTWTQRPFPYNATEWGNLSNSQKMKPHIAACNGKLYVITTYIYQGTSNASSASWFKEYNPATNTWSNKATPAIDANTYVTMTSLVPNGTDVYFGFSTVSGNKLKKFSTTGGTWSDVKVSGFDVSAMGNYTSSNESLSGCVLSMDSIDRLILYKGSSARMYFYTLSDGNVYNIASGSNFIALASSHSFRGFVTAGSSVYIIPQRFPVGNYPFDQNWMIEGFSTNTTSGSPRAETVIDNAAIYKVIPDVANVTFQLLADRPDYNELCCFASDGTDLFGFTFVTPRVSTIDRYDIENDTWDEAFITLPKPFAYPNMDIDEEGDIYLFENFGHFIYKYDISENKMYQLNRNIVIGRTSLAGTDSSIQNQYIVDMCVVRGKCVVSLSYLDLPNTGIIEKWGMDMSYSVGVGRFPVSNSFFGSVLRPTPNVSATQVHTMIGHNGKAYRATGSGLNLFSFDPDTNSIELVESVATTVMNVTTVLSKYKNLLVFLGTVSSTPYLVAYDTISRQFYQIKAMPDSIFKSIGVSADEESIYSMGDSFGVATPRLQVGEVKVLDFLGRGEITNFLGVDGGRGNIRIRIDGKDANMETYEVERVPEWSDMQVKFNSQIEIWIDQLSEGKVGVVYNKK